MSRGERLGKLKKVPAIAGMDHRFFLDANGEDKRLAHLPRKERRRLAAEGRKLAGKYKQILLSLLKTGIGYPIDKLLRQLAVEYTHRYAASGIATQPASFNYFESFCSIDLIDGSVAPYAVPLPEIDHLFTVADYFDFITSKDAPAFDLSELIQLPEGLIYHFTQNGSIQDFTYTSPEGREFLISGFSMVRRAGSLHWYVMGGEVLSEEEWKREEHDHKVDLESTPAAKRRFLARSIELNGDSAGTPVPLEGTQFAIRTIFVGETDLLTGKHLARCHMAETERTFRLIPDDPEFFDEIRDSKRRQELIDAMKERVENAAVMWNLAEAFFRLPGYFKHRLTVSKNTVDKSGKAAPRNTRGGRGVGATFKHVTSIEISDEEPSVVRSYTAPHLEVDTEGHWRRLAPEKYGEDVRGNKVKGRTWVKADNAWRARSDEARPVYIKSSVAAAKIQVADYIQSAQRADEAGKEVPNKLRSVLYVMRCFAMQDEVYKVGWTSKSAEERASELSAATGVPQSFAVVETWQHTDPDALEKGVHAMLSPYRLNAGREFFKIRYPELQAIVQAEISRSQR